MEEKKKHLKNKLSKTKKQFYYDLLMKARGEFMTQVKFHADEALTSHKDSAGERAGMATHVLRSRRRRDDRRGASAHP